MPYIHSQPSTSSSHLLSSQHHSAPHRDHDMEPSDQIPYRDEPSKQEGDQSSTSTDSPSPAAPPPTGLPSVTLAPGVKKDGSSSIYAPKLRSAVRTLQAVRVAAQGSGRYDWASSSAGAEPGVDPKKANFTNLAAPLNVSISQWNQFEVRKEEFRDKDTANLQEYIETFDPEAQDGKVTWINVNGLNWTAIKAIAIKFELHPLALEDALNYTRLSNSKAEWYPESLFVRLLTHELIDLDESSDSAAFKKRNIFSQLLHKLGKTSQRSAEIEALETYDHQSLAGEEVETALGVDANNDVKSIRAAGVRRRGTLERRYSEHAGLTDQLEEKGLTAHAVVQRLTKKYRIPIRKQQLAIFMTKGCIISIFSYDGSSLLSPIYERLGTPGTVLRSSEDASMLLHALLDVTVDETMTIAEAFRAELDVLEGRALIKPDTAGVRNLHVLSGQLLLLKRALTPLSSLVSALRHHDEERALMAMKASNDTKRLSTATQKIINSMNDDVPGFLSKEARQYLSDVQDHVDSVLSSLEMFAFMANGTADYIFNSLSFTANQAMQWLTLFTVIFLPLTFVTGFYGMNFSIFPDIGVFGEGGTPRGPNPTGDIAFFWKISGPLVAIVTLVLLLTQFGDRFVNLGLRAVNSQQQKDAARRRARR